MDEHSVCHQRGPHGAWCASFCLCLDNCAVAHLQCSRVSTTRPGHTAPSSVQPLSSPDLSPSQFLLLKNELKTQLVQSVQSCLHLSIQRCIIDVVTGSCSMFVQMCKCVVMSRETHVRLAPCRSEAVVLCCQLHIVPILNKHRTRRQHVVVHHMCTT